MRVCDRRWLALVLLLFIAWPLTRANADPQDHGNRQRALDLFAQGKRLEALPLLEKQVQQDPKDGDALVALAACLVERAATLEDAAAAGQERLRARALVQQAWSEGYSSTLEENLRQLLRELPASGEMKFSDNPAVQEAMNSGEAAFARRDFDEALGDYGKALELEPTNYNAALFTGNTYDKRNDFRKAADWYAKAIRIDPNVETAYRYYADMLARQGDMAAARGMLIEAAVAEPYNKIVWREIRAWAIINKTAFNIVYIGIPAPEAGRIVNDKANADVVSAAWSAYYSVRAEWQKGGRFEARFPHEAEYRHSLPEETEALTAAAKVLETLKADEKTRNRVVENPNATLLENFYRDGLIEAYVLFSLADDGIAKDYKAYRAENRSKLEIYLDKFVLPPAPARRTVAQKKEERLPQLH